MEAADLMCDEWMGPDGPVDREHPGAKPVLMVNGSFSTVATILIDDSNGAVPHRLVNSFNIANNEGNRKLITTSTKVEQVSLISRLGGCKDFSFFVNSRVTRCKKLYCIDIF